MARTNAGTTTTTTAYTYDVAERMTAAGTTTFAYDKNGNQTSRTTGTTTTAYAYDFEDRLIKAGTKTYARDAQGRVASTTEGTTKTDYVYDGQEILQQKVGTAAATHYTQGPVGTMSRRVGTAAPTYYHHDAVGSVTALTSGTGALTDTYSYLAFGGVRARTGTTAQPLQYVGNPYDSAAGMHDFEARFYDQGAGRFQGKDPVRGFAAMPRSLNPYAYGYGNPLAYPDPDGRCPICIAGLLAAGKLALDEVGTNAALSGGEYYLDRASDKGGIDWGDFARTVGSDTLDETKQSIRAPWDVPFRKAEKAQEVLNLADKANDGRRRLPSLDDLSRAAGGPDRGGLSKAGRPVR